MKYIMIVPDGMADEPLSELGGRTPLEAAHTANMDFLAKNGYAGLVKTIPDQMSPGSDVGNLALMGYDPSSCYTGRAPLEAANLGIVLQDDEVVFRCNLVTLCDGKMQDYSAGHISTEEAARLIEILNRELADPDIRFVVGKSYRHLMILKNPLAVDFIKIKCTPPHDISGREIAPWLPQGLHAQVLLRIMEKAQKILANQDINRVRVDLKENPANAIWLWGQGRRPNLSSFKERFGVDGAIISAVDLVNGIGRLAGLEIIDVPGATGYYDTNYLGKAQYALNALKTKDFVFIHIEGPDEAGHNGDAKAKMDCIEHIDREIVGTVLNHFSAGEDVRILVLPDHPTPVQKRTHTREPVCFVMYGKGVPRQGMESYDEKHAQEAGLKFSSGEELMKYFMKRS